mgnify:CR=1 FL=1
MRLFGRRHPGWLADDDRHRPREHPFGRLLAAEASAWRRARRAARAGPRILMATNTTGARHAAMLEGSIAIALTLRGAAVDFLVCDGVLPACQMAVPVSQDDLQHQARTIALRRFADLHCRACQQLGGDILGPLGLPLRRLGTLIGPGDRTYARDLAERLPRERIAGHAEDGIAIGEHALAGALRFLGRGELGGTPDAEAVLRRYVEAAALSGRAAARALAGRGYRTAVFHHGIYVPQGPTGDACRRAGVRVVNSNPGYRKNTFIYSHGDTYHHTMMAEPTAGWETMPFGTADEAAIMAYLGSRRVGSRDWIWFHEKPDEDFRKAAAALGIDPGKPLIGLLSNVVWDAQLHFPANAFATMIDWAVETVRYFAGRPDLQLLVRIHPAEIRGHVPSRQPLLPEIRRRVGALPANVFVIDAADPVSSYAAMEACDAAIVYGTKMGVELAAVGKPVIVAGEAWIRNKGLSLDASTREAYFAILDRLPEGLEMAPDTIRRARRYAYHFFFRRMIPLPFLDGSRHLFDLTADSLEAFRPGVFPGLDVICDGILEGTPFVYEAERLGLHDA